MSIHEDWLPVLALDSWFDSSYVSPADMGGDWAYVESVQWEYTKFCIKYAKDIASLDDAMSEWVVVHELCHILLAPMRAMVLKMLEILDEEGDSSMADEWLHLLDERITTDVAKALIRARRG